MLIPFGRRDIRVMPTTGLLACLVIAGGCMTPWRSDEARVIPMVHVNDSRSAPSAEEGPKPNEAVAEAPAAESGSPRAAPQGEIRSTPEQRREAGAKEAASDDGREALVRDLLEAYGSSLKGLPPEESAQRFAALMTALDSTGRARLPAVRNETVSEPRRRDEPVGSGRQVATQDPAPSSVQATRSDTAPGSTEHTQRQEEPSRVGDAPRHSRPAALVSAAKSDGAQPASPTDSASDNSPQATSTDWREHLQRTIADLQADLAPSEQESPVESSELARREVLLKMLQVIAGDTEGAFADFQYNRGREAAFWRDELFALHLGIREHRTPVVSQRAARMLEHLRTASQELAAISALDLRGAAFCKNVKGYADIEPFRPYRFTPDQEVLLYVEVENFATERTDSSLDMGAIARHAAKYETEFRGSYQILDGEQRRVADQQLPLAKTVSGVQLRDYYIVYRIYMPRNIQPGNYTLELTLEDVKGEKFGQAFLDFEIKPQ